MEALSLVALAHGWHGRLSLCYNRSTGTAAHREPALASTRHPAAMKPLKLQAQGTPLRAAWRERAQPCALACHAAVPAHAGHVKYAASSLSVNGPGAQLGVSVMFR